MTTDIYNNTSALIFDVLKHIHIANKSGAAATFSLWLGATGGNVAGTELFTDVSIEAGDYFDWYGNIFMDNGDFLVGGSDTATALTLMATTEQFVV
jgi:hypothetical protein